MNKRKKRSATGLSWPALKKEWREAWAARAPVLLFGAKFGGLVLVLYILLAAPVIEQALYYYLEANAWISNAVLRAFGAATQVTDVTIRSADFAIAIRRGCDAVEPTWLLCAAMVAFPCSWRSKLVGMGVGIVVLQALNVVRIVTLYWVGSRFPTYFPSAHLEVWPVIFIIAAILLFVGWKDWTHAK